MKRKHEHKIKIISYSRLIIGIFALIVLLFSVLAEFFYKETKISNENSRTILKEYAVNSANATEMELTNALNYIVYQAKVFSEFDDIHSKEALAMLAKIKNSDLFTIMRLTTIDGRSIDYVNTEVNISDREYFKSAINGTPVISNRVISKSTGKEIIVVCAPIYKNGQIIGTLHGSYDTERLSELIDTSCFNGESSASIITGKGEKVFFSKNDLSDGSINFFEKMKNADFKDNMTYSSFIYSISNKQAALSKYLLDGEPYVTYTAPVGINDWIFVQTVPERSFTSNSDETIKNVIWLLLKVTFIMSVFLVIIYILINKNIKTAQNTAKRISMLINNLSCGVIGFRANDSSYVDYVSDSMFSMFGYDSADAELYKDKLKIYLSAVIAPEYYTSFKDAVDRAEIIMKIFI